MVHFIVVRFGVQGGGQSLHHLHHLWYQLFLLFYARRHFWRHEASFTFYLCRYFSGGWRCRCWCLWCHFFVEKIGYGVHLIAAKTLRKVKCFVCKIEQLLLCLGVLWKGSYAHACRHRDLCAFVI